MPFSRISPARHVGGHVDIPGSKSESNRLLILQALFPTIGISNLSSSDDTVILQRALANRSGLVDVGHAGTAMRFLTAYFAATAGDAVILTGSSRMKKRPIGVLVDALRSLGAQIDYMEADGFPPLRIHRNSISQNQVTVYANISSQFVTALMLIAPSLPQGVQIELMGKIASEPYLDMTLSLLDRIGIGVRRRDNLIGVAPAKDIKAAVTVESDWSSASYFYSIVALSSIGTTISLSSFLDKSIQGDRALVNIYESFGVETIFDASQIVLTKVAGETNRFDFDFSDNPDLAQTVAVTCLGMGIPFTFTGLETLRIKETDRIAALSNEIRKFGGSITIDGDALNFEPGSLLEGITVNTYDDHRMAMAFAALAVRMPVVIEDFDVVSKSFPGFAHELRNIGLAVTACK